ncbi:hypothetical protein BAE44_0014574 [Dichanthelium oligosanthes]|uniref:THH1/TOM1/TOM3 domain-containing protein n=1 Tax=Dichanthelium oligosanthes TaxID=888268 RepID=A0A1E5VH60_9POAL|nr:hypothetical protein BAE44_0014574 [Dichanthelium oligosanthes]
MGRYGSFPAAAGDGGGCLPLPIVAAEGALAVVDGAIAAASFVQVGLFDLVSSIFAPLVIDAGKNSHVQSATGMDSAKDIPFDDWPIKHRDGFAGCMDVDLFSWVCCLGTSPQILLLASFLLLLSFWVDLCHQTNDEDEEDVSSHREALLDRTKAKPGIRPVNIRQRCCPGIQLGSRQKFVILASFLSHHYNLLVLVLSFVVMFAFAILIWVGRGENPIDSSLLKRVYLDVFSVVVLVLGGALACYGALLFSKMSKVRSETVSTEKWKVASLAAVSLICFSSSAILALVTNVPVLLYWYSTDADIIYNAVILFVYYFIGSSVPSGFVLWIMRDLPHRQVVERPTESRVVTLFRERPSTTQDPQWRTAVASSNKVLQLL